MLNYIIKQIHIKICFQKFLHSFIQTYFLTNLHPPLNVAFCHGAIHTCISYVHFSVCIYLSSTLIIFTLFSTVMIS